MIKKHLDKGERRQNIFNAEVLREVTVNKCINARLI